MLNALNDRPRYMYRLPSAFVCSSIFFTPENIWNKKCGCSHRTKRARFDPYLANNITEIFQGNWCHQATFYSPYSYSSAAKGLRVWIILLILSTHDYTKFSVSLPSLNIDEKNEKTQLLVSNFVIPSRSDIIHLTEYKWKSYHHITTHVFQQVRY